VKHPDWRVEPTAGSYFKNLPPGFQAPGLPHSPGTQRIPAGALLDACDCRGLRVGDAMVFAKHANILVNAGRATAVDMLTLAETMKARVRAKFGVELEEEVMFLGPRPPCRRGGRDRAMSGVERALADLDGSRRRFLAEIEGVSDGDFVRRPAQDSWSVSQVVEHIALSEGAMAKGFAAMLAGRAGAKREPLDPLRKLLWTLMGKASLSRSMDLPARSGDHVPTNGTTISVESAG